jgi:hypothetical protein
MNDGVKKSERIHSVRLLEMPFIHGLYQYTFNWATFRTHWIKGFQIEIIWGTTQDCMLSIPDIIENAIR